MARRFIVDKEDIKEIDENNMEIFGKEVKHIQVLRHNVGDIVIVNEYDCKITDMYSHSIVLEILQTTKSIGIPNVDITLYMGMLKNDKMDFLVQKAVELGVKNIVPFFSKNVIVKLDDKGKIKRRDKLQIIANEACKQCGRTDSVKICDFKNFSDVVKFQEKYDVSILAYENEKKSLKDIMDSIKKYKEATKISIIVGAEGGFEQLEVSKLLENENVYSVSLGERILRAETAALNLISIIMYELD